MASEGIGIARQGPDIAEQVVNCPRCDSPNTKFCYYNNYSLSQPRHFCKTCRRYWTKGGALRNVPVGGGSRKNKRLSKSSVLSRLSLVSNDHPGLGTNYSDPGVSLQNLLSGPSQLVPASTDFQLGVFPFSRMNSPPSYNNISTTTNNKFMSINGDQIIPQNIASPFGNKVNTSSSTSIGTNMVSSIESLSFINQDLHLKLQQQRMSMLYAKESNETMATKDSLEGNAGPQSSDFAETSGLQRGWYVENSFAETTGTGTGTSASISNNDTCNNMNIGNNGNNLSYWNGNGSSSWNEIPQFAAMQ